MACLAMLRGHDRLTFGCEPRRGIMFFGGPLDQQTHSVGCEMVYVSVLGRSSEYALYQNELPNSILIKTRDIPDVYVIEEIDSNGGEVAGRRVRFARFDGYVMRDDDIRIIYDLLRHAQYELIPEPNILTDFNLWFRRACYKHRITERIVREVEGVDRGW